MDEREDVWINVNGVEYKSLDAVPPTLRPLAEKQLEAARAAMRRPSPSASPDAAGRPPASEAAEGGAKLRLTIDGVEYKSLAEVPQALRALAEKQLAVAREAAREWTPQGPPGKIDVKFKIDIRRSGAPPAAAPRPPSVAAPPAVTPDSRWPAAVAALVALAAAAVWMWLKR